MVVVTYQAEKIWTYDHTTVWPSIQGATFNMHGQLYRGHANATALSSSPMVSALSSESDDLGSSPGQGKALCPWDVWGKKKCKLCFQAWLNLYINSLLILILMGFVLEIFHFTGWKYCLVWSSYLLILSLLRHLGTLMNHRMAVVPTEKIAPTLILLMDCCP